MTAGGLNDMQWLLDWLTTIISREVCTLGCLGGKQKGGIWEKQVLLSVSLGLAHEPLVSGAESPGTFWKSEMSMCHSGADFPSSFSTVSFSLFSHCSNYKTSEYEQAKLVCASGCKTVSLLMLEMPFHRDYFCYLCASIWNICVSCCKGHNCFLCKL